MKTEFERQLWVYRSGIQYERLSLANDDSMQVVCETDGEIKLRISATARWNQQFDYNTDTLVPVVIMEGQSYKLGEYSIGGSTMEHDGHTFFYKLSGFDKAYYCRKYKVEKRPFFPAGMQYTTAIANMLTLAGIIDYAIEASPLVFREDREDWEPGTPYLTIINQLLSEINYRSLYMDLNGALICRQFSEPSYASVTKEYYNNRFSIIYPQFTVEVDGFDHPNVFHYTYENPETGESFYAVSENSDPDNRFSTVNQGRVPVYQTVDSVPDQETLQKIADRARLESSYRNDVITFSTALNPTHEPFEVIALRKEGFSGVVQETGWTMDLSLGGTMTHVGKRILYD